MRLLYFLPVIQAMTKAEQDKRINNMTVQEALHAVKKLPAELHDIKAQLLGKGGKVTHGKDESLVRATEILNNMISATEDELTLELETYHTEYIKNLDDLTTSQLDRDGATKQAAEANSNLLHYEGVEQTQKNLLEQNETKLQETHSWCSSEKTRTHDEIKLLEGDSKVIGAIMDMVNCKKTMLLQCFFNNHGQKKSYYGIHDKAVAKKVAALQTPAARLAVQRFVGHTLGTAPKSLFQKSFRKHHHKHHLHHTVLHAHRSDVDPNVVAPPPSNHTNADTSRSGTDMRVDPATEPIDESKQQKKCSIDKSPQCPKFTDAMMEMQGEVTSELTQLKMYLAQIETQCETDIHTFELQINNANTLITEAGAAIGENTKIKTESLATAHMLELRIHELTHTMHFEAVEHTKKVDEFHETICGVKVIRKEMYKLKEVEMDITDCELTEWQEGECSATCEGGRREFTREVIQASKNGGEKCGKLEKYEPCNVQPCPIDCVLGEWQGWSECSAVGGCGGGVMTRNRQIKQDSEHGGEMCDVTNESEMCNMQSCDEDCELSEWTAWTGCSKACDTGFQQRKMRITKPAKGNGHCADWHDRHQFKHCNTQPCREDIVCDSEIDVVIMLDSSGSLGEESFNEVRKFGVDLIKRLNKANEEGGDASAPAPAPKAQAAVVAFSGPGTWEDWYDCDDPTIETTDEQCGLMKISPLTSDMEALATKVEAIPWLEMTTNTAGALALAQAYLDDGRPEAQSVVFVVTDGNPNFPEKTYNAAMQLRETARLVFVPIGPYINLDSMAEWCSRPIHENLLPVSESWDLEWLLPYFVASICPVVYSKEKEEEDMSAPSLEDGTGEVL